MANVRDADVPDSWSGTLPPAGAVPWNVTLCRVSANLQVTEPSLGIVTSDGLNVSLGVVTVAAEPLGGGLGAGLDGGAGGGAPGDDP